MPPNIKTEPGHTPLSQGVPRIKPEPQDVQMAPMSDNHKLWKYFNRDKTSPAVKKEPSQGSSVPKQRIPSGTPVQGLPHINDVVMRDPSQPPPIGPVLRDMFTLYDSIDEISYQPEDALKEGLGMVKVLGIDIDRLELGSKLRKEVWLRELESLRSQGAPTTMIAVCGATGAGKSSILNAILDDNIVPTSGMRACTAVVTEIGYHTKKTIDADVSFLSEREWREELTVLLDDLVDEDGNLKRSTDLRSDAGVAWQKVHAVYPSISQERLVSMSVDQIIARDPKIAGILGTTKHITAQDSKSFGKEIAKYIDSKDQKRGNKEKAKTKTKEKPSKGQTLLAKFKKDHTKKKDQHDDPNGPAFWPLIRQVNVRCNAAALSTGALLVDLPGVADANAARNNIAKEYMKKCDCIWVLAPITRAVDDKTARDLMGDAFKMQLMNGNYDAHAITFIATKCDDISCSEVIRALNLEDEPELEAIEAEIHECKSEASEWSENKNEAALSAKNIEAQLKHIREVIREHEAHIEALENGDTFIPVLSGKPQKKGKGVDKSQPSVGTKRKRSGSTDKSHKRRRKSSDDDDSDGDSDDFIDDDTDSSEAEAENSDIQSDSDDEASGSESESGTESDEEEEDVNTEAITVESLNAKIVEAKDAIKEGRAQLNEYRRLKKEAGDKLAGLKKRESKAQREKNAFCSLRRSEFSHDVLKEDFRVGLKDLDDAAAEQRDPDGFDPTVNLRDYDTIDLPVFTCSARDYVRIKGQVKGDGDPTCFTNSADTGIPSLQKWCHSLTVASRERAARNFLTHLKTFANSVRTYVEGIGDVTDMDREVLREKWQSSMSDDDDEDDYDPLDPYGGGWASSDVDLSGLTINGLAAGTGLYALPRKAPKIDNRGELIGITPRLIKDFKSVVDGCVEELQGRFKDGLDEKCRVGAVNAAAAAVETSDTFAASMHWATYRATLRRLGSWRQDLNVELSNPFTRNIASTWSQVFEADLFSTFEKAAKGVIQKVLKEVDDDAPAGLKDRAKIQGDLSLEEATVALNKTIDVVRDTLTTQQKEVSRCLAPHVQEQLRDGYERAMEERGRGSVARQKAVFHDYVNNIKGVVFDNAAEVIMGRLAQAAEAVGNALEEALAELAEKVEVSTAVLWEGTKDSPRQIKTRMQVIANTAQIIAQAQLWTQASEMKRAASVGADE